MDTYWHYRYRLINYFMQVGMGTWEQPINCVSPPCFQGGFGQSLPAYARNGGSADNGINNNIWWSDVGRNMGYYIGTLATEYYLLYQNGQNTNETAMELFYALHALFRLDSIGLTYWITWICPEIGVNSNIIPSGKTLPITFPGEGYMCQDDVPSDFYNKLHPNPIPVISGIYGCAGQQGSGEVGCINTVSAGWSGGFIVDGYCDMPGSGGISQDNYFGVLMGLTLTVKLLGEVPSVTSFYDSHGNITNIQNLYNTDLRGMAKKLGTQILQYLFNCPLVPKYPDGSSYPDAGNSGHLYCQPLEEINSSFFSASNAPHCSDYLLSDWVAASNLCDLEFSLGCGSANTASAIEMACELAAMSNDGGGETVQNTIESLGNYPHNIGCILCHDVTPNHYGEDLLFEAVHQVLYPEVPGNFGYINFCDMENIINSAPYDGPYKHYDFNQPNADYACCGWASPNRFIWGPPFQSGGTGWSGNFNGLDYMLFYNLYCICSQEYENTPITFSGTYPSLEAPPSDIVIGDIGNVLYYSNCLPIQITNFTLLSNANINNINYPGAAWFQTSDKLYIDINSYQGMTDIQSGPNTIFEAACPNTNCCIPDPFIYESDPGLPSDKKAIKMEDTSDYKMSNEFAPKPTYNAILAYPNPFQIQTTLEFAVKETTPVTISIFDLAGQKIIDIISNQTYNQGNYAYVFNGSSLADGTYLCVMTTKDDRKTMKIIKQ